MEQDSLAFPATCHFKIIAKQLDDIQPRLEAVLAALQIKQPLEAGRVSAGGQYKSFNLSMEVESLARMKEIDRALGAVDGVKLVL